MQLAPITQFLQEEGIGLYNKAYEVAKATLVPAKNAPAVPSTEARAVRLVCGTPALSLPEAENVYVDIGWLAQSPLNVAVVQANQTLQHAAWRSVFLTQVEPKWKVAYKTQNPALELLTRMLENGVGIWGNVTSIDVTSEVELQEREVFQALAEHYTTWRDSTSSEARVRQWLVVERQPLWQRWTSTPVGIALRRLSVAYGSETVADMLAEDRLSIFMAYDDACARFLTWPHFSPELIQDVRTLYKGE